MMRLANDLLLTDTARLKPVVAFGYNRILPDRMETHGLCANRCRLASRPSPTRSADETRQRSQYAATTDDYSCGTEQPPGQTVSLSQNTDSGGFMGKGTTSRGVLHPLAPLKKRRCSDLERYRPPYGSSLEPDLQTLLPRRASRRDKGDCPTINTRSRCETTSST